MQDLSFDELELRQLGSTYCISEEFVQLNFTNDQKLVVDNTLHYGFIFANKYIDKVNGLIDSFCDVRNPDLMRAFELCEPNNLIYNLITKERELFKNFDNSKILANSIIASLKFIKASFASYLHGFKSRPKRFRSEKEFTSINIDIGGDNERNYEMYPEENDLNLGDTIIHKIWLGKQLNIVECEKLRSDWIFPNNDRIKYLKIIKSGEKYILSIRYKDYRYKIIDHNYEPYGISFLFDGLHCTIGQTNRDTIDTIHLNSVSPGILNKIEERGYLDTSDIRRVNDEVVSIINNIIKYHPEYIITEMYLTGEIRLNMINVLQLYDFDFLESKVIRDYITIGFNTFIRYLLSASFINGIYLCTPNEASLSSKVSHCIFCGGSIEQEIFPEMNSDDPYHLFNLFRCNGKAKKEPYIEEGEVCQLHEHPFDLLAFYSAVIKNIPERKCKDVGLKKFNE